MKEWCEEENHFPGTQKQAETLSAKANATVTHSSSHLACSCLFMTLLCVDGEGGSQSKWRPCEDTVFMSFISARLTFFTM